MSHGPAFPKIESSSALPNPTFLAWLKSQTALFVSQIVGLVSVLLSLTYYGSHLYEAIEQDKETIETANQNIQLFIDYAHVGILFIFIVWLIKVLEENDRGRYRVGLVYKQVFNEDLTRAQRSSLRRTSKLQLRRFKKYFLCFWCVMWVLYIVFTFKHTLQPITSPNSPGDEVTVIKCPESYSDYNCYRIPTPSSSREMITVDCPRNIEGHCYGFPDKKLDAKEVFKRSAYPVSVFALNNLSLWFAFLCFSVVNLPSPDKKTQNKQRRLVYFSGLVILLLTLSLPLLLAMGSNVSITASSLTSYFTVFDAMSGILNAIVLAVLIARLDSKLIGLPSWLIGLLYCYSAVQPLFAVFEQPGAVFQSIQSFVLISVFVFKVYFFLIIMFTLQTGRMLNYLFCFPFLNRRVDSIFENQFEIKTEREHGHGYRFSIMKASSLVYSSDHTSDTQEECDTQVEEVREAMKERQSYYPKAQSGTHWVEISTNHSVQCHSIGLRSDMEVEDLIEESIEKIPYCKYTRT